MMENADMPAFAWASSCETDGSTGLTKREYFAALAMQGLCANSNRDGAWSHTADDVADAAVRYADALLDELER
jgi:hypothetical protein